MTEVLAHLDVNTETLVPDLREDIVIDVLEVTEEMVAVVTEAVIGILPHADIPICLHQIKECEAAIGKSKNWKLRYFSIILKFFREDRYDRHDRYDYDRGPPRGNRGGGGGGNRGGGGNEDADGVQPVMMTFKAFLGTQDDSISDEDAVKKYAEYKLEFKRQQLNEFFVTHKDEEWYVFYLYDKITWKKVTKSIGKFYLTLFPLHSYRPRGWISWHVAFIETWLITLGRLMICPLCIMGILNQGFSWAFR